MHTHSLSHLTDAVLLRELQDVIRRNRAITAELLIYLAEVDVRRLYRPAGYPSMSVYLIRELGFSEDAAWKRIQAARVARAFPAICAMISDGSLHLSAICLLSPYLRRYNGDDLLRAAAGKTKAEIELLLASRYPGSERLEMVVQMPAVPTSQPALEQVEVAIEEAATGIDVARTEPAPGQVGLANQNTPTGIGVARTEPAPGQVFMKTGGPLEQRDPGGDVVWAGASSMASARAQALSPIRPAVSAVARDRFAVEFMMDGEMHYDLRRAQSLLGHQVASGQLGTIFGRALKSLIRELEKSKFGSGSRTTANSRPAETIGGGTHSRYIPKFVRRQVWERDQGQCTFVNRAGQRCPATSPLEFDHIEPVARGGTSTIENLRLRCRAHNQYEAEREFGPEYMAEMRERAPATEPEEQSPDRQDAPR